MIVEKIAPFSSLDSKSDKCNYKKVGLKGLILFGKFYFISFSHTNTVKHTLAMQRNQIYYY